MEVGLVQFMVYGIITLLSVIITKVFPKISDKKVMQLSFKKAWEFLKSIPLFGQIVLILKYGLYGILIAILGGAFSMIPLSMDFSKEITLQVSGYQFHYASILLAASGGVLNLKSSIKTLIDMRDLTKKQEKEQVERILESEVPVEQKNKDQE